MRAEFPPLAEVVARGMFMAASVVGDDRFNEGLWERTSEMMREDCRRDARAALDTLREACTIRTVEQLAALPVGAVVMETWTKAGNPPNPLPSYVFTRFSDGWGAYPGGCPMYPLGSAKNGETVLLLWHPDWAGTR